MTPYSQDVRCADCKTLLTISAVRDDGPRTKTTLVVSCPVCQRGAEVVIPLSIEASTVQVVYYERPVEGQDKRA